MQLNCTNGYNVNETDCVAVYCSNKLSYIAKNSSLNEEAHLMFTINKNNSISFNSNRKFIFSASNTTKYKEFNENGIINLVWNGSSIYIKDLYIEHHNSKYDYRINLPNGTLYLSNATYSKLKHAIEETYKETILVRTATLTQFAMLLQKNYESTIANYKETIFSKTIEALSTLESAWDDYPSMFKKIYIFTQKYSFSLFINPIKLSDFETHFIKHWIKNSCYKTIGAFILQTKPQNLTSSTAFSKFDALVHLVANSCNWEESYAALQTYWALLFYTKCEAKRKCNLDYNYYIQKSWTYEESLQQYITCTKENYNDSIYLSCFVYYLMKEEKIPIPPKHERSPYHIGFEYSYNKVIQDIKPYAKTYFQKNEILQLEKELLSGKDTIHLTVEDLDLMSGQEFELAVSELFKKMGYQVTTTTVTGDQGVDIIAVRNGIRLGIQAKCYTGKVGNSAVQEVVAGKGYYNLNRCMVVTNSTFTSAAIKLAKANNVILWDRHILEEKLLSLNYEDYN